MSRRGAFPRYAFLAIGISILLVLLSPLFAYDFDPLAVVAEHFGAEEFPIYEAHSLRSQ